MIFDKIVIFNQTKYLGGACCVLRTASAHLHFVNMTPLMGLTFHPLMMETKLSNYLCFYYCIYFIIIIILLFMLFMCKKVVILSVVCEIGNSALYVWHSVANMLTICSVLKYLYGSLPYMITSASCETILREYKNIQKP